MLKNHSILTFHKLKSGIGFGWNFCLLEWLWIGQHSFLCLQKIFHIKFHLVVRNGMPACNKFSDYFKAGLFVHMDCAGVGCFRVYQHFIYV